MLRKCKIDVVESALARFSTSTSLAVLALCLCTACPPASPGTDPGSNQNPNTAITVNDFFLGGWRSIPASSSTLADALVFHIGSSSVLDKDAKVHPVTSADAYSLQTATGSFARTPGLATSMLYTPLAGTKTVLYRDVDKAKTTGFRFSIFDHKDPASRALGLGGTAHLSLVLQNVLNESEKLDILRPPTASDSLVLTGPFTPGETYMVKDKVTEVTLGELNPEKNDVNAGSLVVTTLTYNYKLKLEIAGYNHATIRGDVSAASAEDFLLRGESYTAKLWVANTGRPLTVSPAISFGNGIAIDPISVPSSLTISGVNQNKGLVTIAGGESFLYASTVSITATPDDPDFGDKDYLDYNPLFRITDDDGNVWEDSVPIRIWKDKINIEVLGQGVLVTPEGRSIVIPTAFSGPLPRRSAGYLACMSGNLLSPDTKLDYMIGADVDGMDGQGWVDVPDNDVDGADVPIDDDSEGKAVLLPCGVYYSGSVTINGDPVDYLRIGVAPEPAPKTLTNAGSYTAIPAGASIVDASVSKAAATQGTNGDQLIRGSSWLHYTYNGTKIASFVAKSRGSAWGTLYAVRTTTRSSIPLGYATDLLWTYLDGAYYHFDARASNGYSYPANDDKVPDYFTTDSVLNTTYQPFRASILISDYAGGETNFSTFDFDFDSVGYPCAVVARCPSGGKSLAIYYLKRTTSWSKEALISPGGYARPGRDPLIAVDAANDDRLLVTWMEGTRPMYAISGDGGSSWEGSSLGMLGAAEPATPRFESGVAYLYCAGTRIKVGD